MSKTDSQRRKNFYLGALDELERIELKAAATVDGIDDEIAYLRFRIKQMVKVKSPDNEELTRCLNTLCRALVVKFTIQGKNKKAIGEAIGRIVEGLIPAGAVLGSAIINKKL
jgi:hypothetical protein